MSVPKLCVWASGSPEPDSGGSGFENLVTWSRRVSGWYEVVAVVSNYEHGGVRSRADRLGVPFHYFPGPFDLQGYRETLAKVEADFHQLSGYTKCFVGADNVSNIHPGPLPGFGGPGMWGHHVHEAVLEAARQGKVKDSRVSMHFVTWSVDAAGNPDPDFYDRGPCFFSYPVAIEQDDTPHELARRVNRLEHLWQPFVTALLASRLIWWDGHDPSSIIVPNMPYFGVFS